MVILRLSNIEPLASKTVIDGKRYLFKTFAGIKVFGIELYKSYSNKLVDAIAIL